MSTPTTSNTEAAVALEVPKASKKRKLTCNLCLYPNIMKALTKLRHKVMEIENLLYPQLNTRTARVSEIGIRINDMLHYLYAGTYNYCRCNRACNDNIYEMIKLLQSNVNMCEEYLIDMKLMRKRQMPQQKNPPETFNYIWIRHKIITINRRTIHVKRAIAEAKLLFKNISVPTVFRKELPPSYRKTKKNK